MDELNKKGNTRVTIDNTILEILDEYLEENNITNRSKYIEKLIREDFEKKGKKIERNF
jgi:metal-responsive CopG/Arc/MetJ family transcriptional regulator